MATPHVAGGAALYLIAHPGSSPGDVRSALRAAGLFDWRTSTDRDGTIDPLLDVSSFGAGAGLRLRSSTTSVRLWAGGPSSKVRFRLTRLDGQSGDVTMSMAGLPNGVEASFSRTTFGGRNFGEASVSLRATAGANVADGDVSITATSGGVESRHTFRLRVAVDQIAPAVSGVRDSFRVPASVSTSSVWVTTRWTASDSGSGVAASNVSERRDGGAWASLATTAASTRTRNSRLPYLTDVQHRVRARDLVGNLSDFAEGPTIRLRRYSEGTSAATYSSGWTASSNSSALGGGLRYATRSGASVTFRFTRTGGRLDLAHVLVARECAGLHRRNQRRGLRAGRFEPRPASGLREVGLSRRPHDEDRRARDVRPAAYRRRRVPRHAVTDPLLPPATIGILGGGQLGRMLGFAARAMGYRIVVLDPDPECPAAAVADRVVVGAYDDADAALELAAEADVVTYELEHVALDVVRAIIERTPVRPGIEPLRVTQDRLAERRFVERAGIAVAPWRAVATTEALASAASDLGTPLRLKAPTGGYDGRSQVRVAGDADIESAIGHFGRPEGTTAPRGARARVRGGAVGDRRAWHGWEARDLPACPKSPRRGDPRRVGHAGRPAGCGTA